MMAADGNSPGKIQGRSHQSPQRAQEDEVQVLTPGDGVDVAGGEAVPAPEVPGGEAVPAPDVAVGVGDHEEHDGYDADDGDEVHPPIKRQRTSDGAGCSGKGDNTWLFRQGRL
ncbi:unnamed protein product [Urochloa humidicola]